MSSSVKSQPQIKADETTQLIPFQNCSMGHLPLAEMQKIHEVCMQLLSHPPQDASTQSNGCARSIHCTRQHAYVRASIKKGDPLLGKGTFKSVKDTIMYTPGKDPEVIVDAATKRQPQATDQQWAEIQRDSLREVVFMHKFDNNSHFLQVYDTYEKHNKVHVFMEKCESDLAKKVQEGTLSAQQKHQIAEEIVEGIRALHQQGIYHLDIKPENILITQEGHAKIADLGLACSSDEIHQANTLKGSPRYFSPERSRLFMQLKAGQSITEQQIQRTIPQADAWAMGVTLYGLLSAPSATPFLNNKLPHNSTSKYFDEQVNLLITSNIPQEYQPLLRGLLQHNPTKRISPEEALKHLTQVREEK